MKLTPDQQKELIGKLNSLWKNQKICQVCQNNNWSVSDIVFELREYHGGGMVISGSGILPLISITCQNCGQTILMNAMSLGIIKPGSPVSENLKGGIK